MPRHSNNPPYEGTINVHNAKTGTRYRSWIPKPVVEDKGNWLAIIKDDLTIFWDRPSIFVLYGNPNHEPGKVYGIYPSFEMASNVSETKSDYLYDNWYIDQYSLNGELICQWLQEHDGTWDKYDQYK